MCEGRKDFGFFFRGGIRKSKYRALFIVAGRCDLYQASDNIWLAFQQYTGSLIDIEYVLSVRGRRHILIVGFEA
jgi:hypothetical protein